MPRPARQHRISGWLVVALGCAALGPGALHQALAAAAGTLFEAAPFVLAADVLPARFRVVAHVAGCGCRGALPGVLSLPATALCWFAFGPAIAGGRVLLGLSALALSGRGARHARGARGNDVSPDTAVRLQPDSLGELLVLAPSAGLATLAASAMTSAGHSCHGPLAAGIALVSGLAFGAVAPCATAGVAIAAALAPHEAPAAAGILLTSGVIAIPREWWAHRIWRGFYQPGTGQPVDSCTAAKRVMFTRLAVAGALALLAQRGAAGFVNPRMLPLIDGGAGLALVAACRAGLAALRAGPFGPARSQPASRGISAVLVPLVMLAALAAGSPVPDDAGSATQMSGAYPGERLAFVGAVHRSAGASIVERFAITCCRADASPISLRLTDPIGVRTGTWVAVTGRLEGGDRGLALRVTRWRTVSPPADPFLYR